MGDGIGVEWRAHSGTPRSCRQPFTQLIDFWPGVLIDLGDHDDEVSVGWHRGPHRLFMAKHNRRPLWRQVIGDPASSQRSHQLRPVTTPLDWPAQGISPDNRCHGRGRRSDHWLIVSRRFERSASRSIGLDQDMVDEPKPAIAISGLDTDSRLAPCPAPDHDGAIDCRDLGIRWSDQNRQATILVMTHFGRRGDQPAARQLLSQGVQQGGFASATYDSHMLGAAEVEAGGQTIKGDRVHVHASA